MQFHEAERFFTGIPHAVLSETRWQEMDPRPRGLHVTLFAYANYVFVEAKTPAARAAIEAVGCVVIEAHANSAPNSPVHAVGPTNA